MTRPGVLPVRQGLVLHGLPFQRGVSFDLQRSSQAPRPHSPVAPHKNTPLCICTEGRKDRGTTLLSIRPAVLYAADRILLIRNGESPGQAYQSSAPVGPGRDPAASPMGDAFRLSAPKPLSICALPNRLSADERSSLMGLQMYSSSSQLFSFSYDTVFKNACQEDSCYCFRLHPPRRTKNAKPQTLNPGLAL